MNKGNNYVKLNLGFLTVIVFLFAIIIVKLVYVANSPMVDGIDLKAFSASIVQDKKIIRASRGTIFDVNGEPLAQNARGYTVIAYLAESRTTDLSHPRHIVDKAGTAKALSEILGIDEKYLLERFNEKLYQVELGAAGRDISELTKQKIEALDLPGIGFTKTTKRDYPFGDFASYLLGYARKQDGGEIVGEMGIEAKFNDKLKGKDGAIIRQIDAYGYQIANTPEIVEAASEEGYDVYLTIDTTVQMTLETAIREMTKTGLEWATITVADAKTGAIVGSASSPSFNPNALSADMNYNNPLTSYAFEPGSTMKIFSFMAAIEKGKYKGDELYQSGHVMVDGFKISDHNTHGWGKIPFDTGFTYSSNTAAVNLAQKVGREELMAFYDQLGFGKPTGIELPDEYAGDIELIYKSELASAAFGQGITTTPIQNIQALTSITNNGTVLKPYIISKIVDKKTGEVAYEGKRTEGAKVASPETVKKIIDLMDETINGKDPQVTGKRYHTDVLTLIGKTGTGQYILPNGKYSSGGYNYIKSFAGIFPKDEPKFIIYISTKKYLANHEQIGEITKSVVETIAKYKNLEDRPSDIDKSKIVKIQNYLNKSRDEVVRELESFGLTPIVIGNGEVIIKQEPIKDFSVVKGSKVFLLTNGNEIKMPNAIGWTSSEIITFANLAKIPYNIVGFGDVKELSTPPNEIITRETTLNIVLDERNVAE